MKITVSTHVNCSAEKAWQSFTSPEHITNWNFASDEWHCPSASNKTSVGEKFSWRMEAKDGSMGFDFEGTYTEVIPHEKLVFDLGDGRPVSVLFTEKDNATLVEEVFEAEDEHSAQQQKEGWQAILNNYKVYTEAL